MPVENRAGKSQIPAEIALFSQGIIVKLRLQERVRQRLRLLVETKGVSHAVLAEYLGLSRSFTTRMITANAAISLEHLGKICEFFQITASELLVEPGSLIQTLNPLEAQLLRHFREMTELQRHSLLAVLDSSAQQPRVTRRARLGRAELTDEQQLLVDLYARSPEQARSGILKTLRGTAKLGDVERGQHRTTE